MKRAMPAILTVNVRNPAMVKAFLKRYRRVDSSTTPSNLPTACLLQGQIGEKIVELMKFTGDENVFGYWDEGDSFRIEKINRIKEFWVNRKPWEDYDFCIFPETLEWCIGFTHNNYCVLVRN